MNRQEQYEKHKDYISSETLAESLTHTSGASWNGEQKIEESDVKFLIEKA